MATQETNLNRKQRRAQAAKARKSKPVKSRKGKTQNNQIFTRYTSSRGTEALIFPMPPMLMEKIEQAVEAQLGPRPEPPTYTIKTASGDEETHFHTEDTLETDEDRDAWDEYEENSAEWDNELNSRMLRAIQLECIKPADPEDTEWAERLEFLGIPVPDNKFERHMLWVEAEFVGSQEDVLACLMEPMRLAGVPDEEMAAAERMFRGAIQEEAFEESAADGQ